MGLICAISFVAGVFFFTLGAWPITGFFGLDVALIYGAFKLNFRASQQREIIKINDEELKITRISSDGHSKDWHFNRYWVRVEHSFDADDEYDNQPLVLTSHGRRLEIAGFLSRDEKIEFSGVLRTALKAS